MGNYYLMGSEFLIGAMKKKLEIDSGNGCTTLQI